MERLGNKVAIVTGAGIGLGEAQARLIASRGAKVIVADIDRENGARVAADIGANACFVPHDVTRVEDWTRVVAEAEARWGPVNVLVNNAGIAGPNTVYDISIEDYDRFMAVDARGVFLGMRAVVEPMKRAGGGSIVNISSIAGQFGTPNCFGYVAAKFAVTGMTKSAAIDLAPFNIRVNSVHPGNCKSAMDAELRKDPYYVKFFADFLARVPANRQGEAIEVANMVAFLASDESSYSTGGEFTVDGGATCMA